MADLQSLSVDDKLEVISLLEAEERERAKDDPVFFIESYLKTFDPRPEAYPHNLDFILYEFQRDYVLGLVEAIRGGYDLFDEKSRDMGASWLSLAVRFWLWLFEPGYQSLLGSRKEEYVDSGTYRSLFGKLDYFIRNIKDPLILPKDFDITKHRTYMKLVNPANNNVIEGESSNKNFSRAGRYKDILYDEFGFWPDARSSWTAGGDATHCRHAITTPPDEPSFAKTIRFGEKIKVRTWHWTLHPNKNQQWYDYEKSRRTNEEVLHEIDISWEYSDTGRPYPEINQVVVGQHPYAPNAPLYISIDLGLDAIALGYYQPIQNSNYIKLIEAFEVSDHIIDWCLPMLGQTQYLLEPICTACGKVHSFVYTDEQLRFIKLVKDWQPDVYFGDPSGKSRHVESGVSPYEILQQHGIDVQVNEAENDWVARRDATKRLLPKLVVNDTPRTKWWLECMKNARYPKRDPDTSQAVNEVSKPVHDWTSHMRTQFEFFAVNYQGEFTPDSLPVTAKLPGSNIPLGFEADQAGNVQFQLDLSKVAINHNMKDWKYQ
jgi:hypothetical protein